MSWSILPFVAFSLVVLTSIASYGQDHPCNVDLNGNFMKHDPSRGFSAIVMVIDRSKSVRPEQFRKLRSFLEGQVEELQFNDKVWLIDIEAPGYPNTVEYDMPSGSSLTCKKMAAEKRMSDMKSEISGVIEHMTQESDMTDLADPLEHGMDILEGQIGASRRVLAVASDFLTDEGRGCTVMPPKPYQRKSNQGFQGQMLLTDPNNRDLAKCGLTWSGWSRAVNGNWPNYFTSSGAERTTVRDIDTVVANAVPQVQVPHPK